MASDGGCVSGGGQVGPSMLEACSSGDIATLQRLFADHGIQPGSDYVRGPCIDLRNPQAASAMTEPHKIPLTGALIARAVAAKQVDIVKFILHIYPSFSLSQALSIVNALLDNPDPAVLQVLCDHDPAFSSFSIDYHFQSFFTEACRRPPEKIVPVLHVLLDNGADLWDGFGPGAGALWAALEGGQPIEIIDKIVNKAGGEMISRRNVSLAIQLGRADVVQLLLLKNHKLIRPGALNAEKVLEDAQKTANQKIITMVQTWMLKRKVEEKRTGDAKGSTKKRWWKLWSVLNERLGHGVA